MSFFLLFKPSLSPHILPLAANLPQLAGALGKTLEYPFDTIKVRLQAAPPHLYAGPLDCLRQSLAHDGIRGLYRGISAPLVGAAVETSSLFWSYRIAKDILIRYTGRGRGEDKEGILGLGGLCVAGAMSGAFTSLLLTPIELVKCQIQVPSSTISSPSHRGTSPGPLSVIASIFRHHGLLGFWHGQLGTLIRETGGSAAWFGAYEGVGAAFRKYNVRSSTVQDVETGTLRLWQQLLAGASAGVAYNFVFFPADTVKSRMQTEDVNPVDMTGRDKSGKSKRATFWRTGKELWQSQGLRGLYRGCGITVARAAPSSAVIFAVYEGLRGWA